MSKEIVELVCAIIAAASAIMVALIGREVKRSNNITEEASKKMAEMMERRKEESLLSLQMISATMDLSIVSANALTGGHNNGNVEAAREKAKAAEEKYRQFEHRILAEELNKM